MKAVITAAGLSPKFMPYAGTIPKEMFPVGRKPAIHHVVAEAVSSGVDDILIVVGQGRRCIQDYFECGLFNKCKKDGVGKTDAVDMEGIELPPIHYITQESPNGLGNVLLCARKHVGDETFALLLGDDVVMGGDDSALSQLIMCHRGSGKMVVGVEKSQRRPPTRGAVVKGDMISPAPPTFLIDRITRKAMGHNTERMLTMGRYILPPTIFHILEEEKNRGEDDFGKLELLHAMDNIAMTEGGMAVEVEGKRYDMGSPEDVIEANRIAWKLPR